VLLTVFPEMCTENFFLLSSETRICRKINRNKFWRWCLVVIDTTAAFSVVQSAGKGTRKRSAMPPFLQYPLANCNEGGRVIPPCLTVINQYPNSHVLSSTFMFSAVLKLGISEYMTILIASSQFNITGLMTSITYFIFQ
jgi:hypothetical protein